MALANSLVRYLIRNGVSYEVVAHQPTACSAATAHVTQVPCGWVAKSVVLKDEQGYLLAVLPASNRLQLSRLHQQLHRAIGLATEDELRGLFGDCALGAVPPLGPVYGLKVVVDDSLLSLPCVYFEGGDHLELVKVKGGDFQRLLSDAWHGRFSAPLALDSQNGLIREAIGS